MVLGAADEEAQNASGTRFEKEADSRLTPLPKRRGGRGDGGVVRVKRYAAKPMSVEDAILEMDMLGHSFYMFNDIETGMAATVYRRKDGGCGLIELENL